MTAASDLRTIGDLIRFGVSRFSAAQIAFGHGTSDAAGEAAFIVLESLYLPPDSAGDWWAARLTLAERERAVALIEQRIATRKPAAYLLNKAYIQGVPFYVDERVIVPRSFIGEILFAEDGFDPPGMPAEVNSVLDLCTGSGCLAILAAHVFPQARIDAVDLSADALDIARRNVGESGLTDRITLHHGDLFAPLGRAAYDLIITNPPYVDAAGMAARTPEHRHEPALAFDGGTDGLDILRRILAAAPAHLNAGGGMICEIGRGRAAIEEAFPDLPFLWLETAESEDEVFWLTADDLNGHCERSEAIHRAARRNRGLLRCARNDGKILKPPLPSSPRCRHGVQSTSRTCRQTLAGISASPDH